MKLFLISQTQNNGFNSYGSAVVAAPDENVARNMNPESGDPMVEWLHWTHGGHWCSNPDLVTVRYIGEASEDVDAGVLCASFIQES